MDYQSVINLIDKLAQKLSGPAEHVWQVMVRQSYVEGLTSIITFLLCVVFVWLGVKVLLLCAKKYDCDLDDPSWVFILVISIVFLVVTAFVGIAELLEGVKYLANPEYYAMINLLKGGQ